jgi:hypothetical protein
MEGIGDDVRLTVTTAAGPVLDDGLAVLAMVARMASRADRDGEVLPFIYRDPPNEDDDPERVAEERPLRRARLMIIDDGLVPE